MRSPEGLVWPELPCEIMTAYEGPAWHYDICVRPIVLYASETSTLTKNDSDRIDAFDQWCLRLINGVRGSDHITNAQILLRTSQLPLS